jgi:transcriptional regulator GlxA family with amidase domain
MVIDIAVFDGVDELDALGPLEVLRNAASMGAPFDVQLVTVDERELVRGAHGVQIVPDGKSRPNADIIIFPGGGWIDHSAQGVRNELRKGQWPARIQEAARSGTLLASVCTGAMMLAASGVLADRRATTHHGAWDDLEEAGAKLVRERVVDDGNRITAGGVTSGIDLGLWLVERLAGKELAVRVADELEWVGTHPSVA